MTTIDQDRRTVAGGGGGRSRDAGMVVLLVPGSGRGGGYRVGPKWGRFAGDRPSALREAIEELRELGVPECVLNGLAIDARGGSA